MASSIFREKSLQQAKSPDQLDDYIRVSNPSVWIILGVIIILLVSGIVWAVFGTIAESTPGVLVVENGTATCYVEQSRTESLNAGDAISAAGVQGIATSQPGAPVEASSVSSSDGLAASLWGDGSWVRSVEASIDLPNGVYEATVALKTYEPLALLFGGQ